LLLSLFILSMFASDSIRLIRPESRSRPPSAEEPRLDPDGRREGGAEENRVRVPDAANKRNPGAQSVKFEVRRGANARLIPD